MWGRTMRVICSEIQNDQKALAMMKGPIGTGSA